MITKISNDVIAELAASSDYKERFIAEYIQLKQRYEKLKVFNTKIEAAGEMAFRVGADKVPMPKHDCPEELLRRQQHVMGEYLHILEVRAVIEGIDLQKAIEDLARESICRASEFRTVDEGEGRPCCKSESVPPCEEGLDENILSLEDTIKTLSWCDSYKFCTSNCADCFRTAGMNDLERRKIVEERNKSALYHLKKYAKYFEPCHAVSEDRDAKHK